MVPGMSDVLVLCFHAVSYDWPADLSSTPQRLEEALALLVERGYRGATFHDAVTRASPGRTVSVTFDDAYRSVIDLAFPVLQRLGLPATVFVPTDLVGNDQPMAWPGIERWLGGPHERELLGMSWEELGELAAAGWEIGSHTRSHARLTQLSEDLLTQELGGSRRACEERLGRPCKTLAYPYGDVDARVVEATQAAGYKAAATLSYRFRSGESLLWPRVGIYHRDDLKRFRLKTSPAVRRLQSSPAGALVESLRGYARGG